MSLYRTTNQPKVIKAKKRLAALDRPGKPGPKPKEIDWVLVYRLAKIHCTPSEIAAAVEMSEDTLTARHEFAPTYKKGIEDGKKSLRRMQWKTAEAGNMVMQIFLGKQVLDQADRFTSKVIGPNGGAIEFETKYKPDLGKLSVEDLCQLAALMDKAAAAKPHKEDKEK